MTLEYVALQDYTDSTLAILDNILGTEVTTILGKHIIAAHIDLFVETGRLIC